MVRYLTTKEVIHIHVRMVNRYGGSHGIRYLGLVASAVARPQAGFGDFEAYPDLFSKAAVLVHSLLKNHSFIDGNKRTAMASCALFLQRNGYQLTNDIKLLVAFALNIENNKFREEEIAIWLKKNSKSSKDGSANN